MTNRFTHPALGLLLGLALLLGFASQPASAAKKIPVNLRVVTHQGKIIFDRTVPTGTAKIKPSSACPTLGGQRGPARTLAGPTGLGLLYQASFRYKALRPLRISDGDFGFGVCGIGGTMAKGEGWWVVRHNYKDAPVGAELLKLKRRDSVLFYYSKSWQETTPDSLYLKAPRWLAKSGKVRKGAVVKVRALVVKAANGKKSPVEGAKVSGGTAAPTDVRGYTKVKITGKTKLVARQAGLIPSNRVYVSIRK